MAQPMEEDGGGGGEEIILFSTLSILQIIKDAQAQHGLRHGDYQRYAAYCSRKIRRIRKSLKFTHGHKSVPNHSAKFNQKKVTEEVITEDRYLLIPLFDAERAWATAMQLNQESNAEENPRKQHHSIARLRKAVKHATALEGFCKSLKAVDAPTRLEASAYCAYMTGFLGLRTEEWAKATEAFTAAKTVYEKLAGVVAEAGRKALYQARVAELAPQLRICAYNIGDQSAMEDLVRMRLNISDQGSAGIGGDLDKLLAATLEKQQQGSAPLITWAGRQVSVATAGSRVASFVASAAQLAKDAGGAGAEEQMGLYDKLLGECREAIQAVRDEMAKAPDSGGRLGQDGPALQAYLTHQRLSLSNARYLLTVEQAKAGGKCRPSDLVRLYDSMVANLSEMAALGEDPALAKETLRKTAYFNAFRCAAVAAAFAAAKKWPEAMALFTRAAERVADAKKLCGGTADLGLGPLPDLEKELKAARQKAAAGALMEKSAAKGGADKATAEGSSDQPQKPLAEDLATWRRWNTAELVGKAGLGNCGALAPLPPSFQPMPGKPLFFDLALNHIAFPDLTDKCEAPGAKEAKKEAGGGEESGTAQSAGGLGGVVSGVKGWFWGSK